MEGQTKLLVKLITSEDCFVSLPSCYAGRYTRVVAPKRKLVNKYILTFWWSKFEFQSVVYSNKR